MLAEQDTTSLTPQQIENIESHMLALEQADCPVAHHFGPGIYIREVTLPAGIIAIGHAQRFEHLNILLTGKVAIINGNCIKVLEAPLIFTGQPGRKIGYVIETCVWQNVYATHETDVEKLEAYYLDKSDAWLQHQNIQDALVHELHEIDREDFEAMLQETGFTAEIVRQQSENELDQIPMPEPWSPVTTIRDSMIEGRGLFLNCPIKANHIVAPARLNGKRTPAGRYVNHSKYPNCRFEENTFGNIYLVANYDLHGCRGGDNGPELTVDYRQALSLSGIGGQPCQG